MLFIKTKAPVKRSVSYIPGGPPRYDAVTFEGTYRFNESTGKIMTVDILIEIDEAGHTTGIASINDFTKPYVYDMSMERILEILERGWQISIPPEYCLWISYESYPDIFTLRELAVSFIFREVVKINQGCMTPS